MQVATCRSAAAFESGKRPQFEVPYDIAVVAVGERPGTFGVPGVEKYCFFMKVCLDPGHPCTQVLLIDNNEVGHQDRVVIAW